MRSRIAPLSTGMVIAVLTVFSIANSMAQSDCEVLLRSVYRHFASLVSPERANKNFRIDYTLRTVVRNGAVNGSSTTRMEMAVSPSQMRCRTKEVEIYRDKTHMVTVYPGKKMICVQKSLGDAEYERQIKNFTLLQDSVLSLSTVQSCRDVPYNGTKAREIVLAVKKGVQRVIPLESVTYLIDTRHQALNRIHLKYLPSSSIAEVEMTINSFEENYRNDSLSKPVTSLFLAGERLLPRYRDYRLVDLRKTSSTTVNKSRK